MRLLEFNGDKVDIDNETAIGIDIKGYDITEPGERKVNVSNNFTIPPTAKNKKLIGFAGNPQSLSLIPYNRINVNYYNKNTQLIKNGSVRIGEVGKRISIIINEKKDFWALMQTFEWIDFLQEFITWMQTEKSLPSLSSPFVGTFQAFVNGYINTTEGLFMPYTISNLSKYSADGVNFLEDTSTLWLKYQDNVMPIPALGGHFYVYCKTIFEFIEYKYGVDFSVTSTEYDYNIFEDAIASLMYIPARNISIEYTLTGFYFSVDTTGQFLPVTNSEDKTGKMLYDFVKAFFQHFNCLIDKIPTLENSEKFIIRRFDEISNAPVIDFSGNISGDIVFKPILDGYKQINYIKFTSVYEGGNELVNSKKIICQNKNIESDADNTLFSIDAYIPGSFAVGANNCMDMSVPDSFKTFSFFISDAQITTTIKISESNVEYSANVILKIAKLYSLESEYETIKSMVEYPVYYEIKKRLTTLQANNIVFFARYWIKELNGYYFINQISGYNPEKSFEETKLELIKIPV